MWIAETLIWLVIVEWILLLSAVAAFLAAVILVKRHHGIERLAWALIALAWAWIVAGEIALNVFGYYELIYRWLRAIPARILTAAGFWVLVIWRWR